MNKIPSIPEFYKDRSVLITGATGFIGKVLIEKLLRCCKDLSKLYILVRPKDKQDVQSRVKDLLSCCIFDNLHISNPSFINKVVGIEGNILESNLGLSQDDRILLTSKVSIVIHSAASIRFNDTLHYATKINVEGTLKVVQLSKDMPKLLAFIHLSTAFSNCDKSYIDEKISPPPMDPRRVLSLCEWLRESDIESMCPNFIKKKITTYHFTKALTETVLQEESKYLPIVIVRPSVVVGAWKEPLPGYTETLYHINGILVASGRGVLRILHCDPKSVVDIVPVDMVCNLLIATAWYKATKQKIPDASVYNFVSCVDTPLSYGNLRDYSISVTRLNPLMYPIWYPSLILVPNRFIAKILSFMMHRIPAFIIDSSLKLIGMPPRLEKIVNRIEKSQKFNEKFLNREYKFCNKNVKSLWASMTHNDQEKFYFDISQLPWKPYMKVYYLGCKQYVVKESLSTLARARRHMGIMKTAYYFINIAVVIFFVFLLKYVLFA